MTKKYLFLLVIYCALISCHPDRFFGWFSIKNNSSKGICYSYSNLYPDTSIPKGNYVPSGSPGPPSITIQPGESYSLLKAASLDSYFNSVTSGTMELFIFDSHTVETVSWDSVRTNYLILKRYDLTLDSIKKMNGVINFP